MNNQENKISDKIGKTAKYGSIGTEMLYLIEYIIGYTIASLILIYLMILGLSLYIGLSCIGLFIFMFIIGILRLKKIASVRLDSQALLGTPSVKMDLLPDEKILASFAGIMRVGFYLRSTVTFINIPEIKNPENAMIVTNKRVLFVYVPLSGADKMIGTDVGMWDWILAKKDIESKLNEMVSNYSISEIYNSYPKNFFIDFEDLLKVNFNGFQRRINFFTRDNKKHSYSFRAIEDFDQAKQVFRDYIK